MRLGTAIIILLSFLSLIFAYLSYKNQTLRSERSAQEELNHQLQPEYHIGFDFDLDEYPDFTWPDEFYFTVWSAKVSESRNTWRKWLPRHNFQGVTRLYLKFYGADAPPAEDIDEKWFREGSTTIEQNPNHPDILIITVDTVNPELIDRLLRDFATEIRGIYMASKNSEAVGNTLEEFLEADHIFNG